MIIWKGIILKSFPSEYLRYSKVKAVLVSILRLIYGPYKMEIA